MKKPTYVSRAADHYHVVPKGNKFTATCNHCEWRGDYFSDGVARRVAGNHIVKQHPDQCPPKPKFVAKSPVVAVAEEAPPIKRPYTPRKPKPTLGVNFCPGCGCNLNAVRVALSL